jgi:hypothetical protein
MPRLPPTDDEIKAEIAAKCEGRAASQEFQKCWRVARAFGIDKPCNMDESGPLVNLLAERLLKMMALFSRQIPEKHLVMDIAKAVLVARELKGKKLRQALLEVEKLFHGDLGVRVVLSGEPTSRSRDRKFSIETLNSSDYGSYQMKQMWYYAESMVRQYDGINDPESILSQYAEKAVGDGTIYKKLLAKKEAATGLTPDERQIVELLKQGATAEDFWKVAAVFLFEEDSDRPALNMFLKIVNSWVFRVLLAILIAAIFIVSVYFIAVAASKAKFTPGIEFSRWSLFR